MTEIALTRGLPQLPALSEHRTLRLMTLILLYFAQGLPFGLFDYALPAWLAQNGASAAAIGGVLALIGLPWTFKLAYGFVTDRYAFLAMGRRRPWIILSQFGLVAALLAMAAVNPGVHQFALLGAFAFALGLASSIQDVAVDGLAVDILPEQEIEHANGFMFGGQAIGIAAGAAVSGTLIAYRGLPSALLTLAALTAAILVLVIAVRERTGERLLPWTQGAASQRNLDLHLGAFGPIVRNLFSAMFTRQTLILVPGLLAATAAYGIFLGMAPLFASDVLGWQKDTYSGWSSQAQLIAGLTGGILFGVAAARWGARRLFIAGMLAVAGVALAILGLRDQWGNPLILIGAIFVFTGLAVLRAITTGALAMRLCTPAIAATQFAVFMAILNLGRTISSAALGWIDSLGGMPAMFIAVAICGLVAAGFGVAAKVGR